MQFRFLRRSPIWAWRASSWWLGRLFWRIASAAAADQARAGPRQLMTLDARAGVEDAPVGLRDRDVMLAFVAGLVVAICWRDQLRVKEDASCLCSVALNDA